MSSKQALPALALALLAIAPSVASADQRTFASGSTPTEVTSVDFDFTMPAATIGDPRPEWGTLAGASWINSGIFGREELPGSYVYTAGMDLPADAADATVTLRWLADNAGTATINGVRRGGTASFSDASAQTVTTPLNAGANTLRFDVVNDPSDDPEAYVNPGGLLFRAVVTYTPRRLPTATGQCLKNGWKGFYDGPKRFRTQGDCVSFVATKGRNGMK